MSRNLDDLIVTALACGRTWAQAAEAAGCSVRHVARRAADPDVRRQVAEVRGRLLEQALGSASDRLTGAVGTLAEVMGDPEVPPAARVSAAAKLIDTALRLRAELDVEHRLARLEELSAARVGGA